MNCPSQPDKTRPGLVPGSAARFSILKVVSGKLFSWTAPFSLDQSCSKHRQKITIVDLLCTIYNFNSLLLLCCAAVKTFLYLCKISETSVKSTKCQNNSNSSNSRVPKTDISSLLRWLLGWTFCSSIKSLGATWVVLLVLVLVLHLVHFLIKRNLREKNSPQPEFEPRTSRSAVWHSTNWAKETLLINWS